VSIKETKHGAERQREGDGERETIKAKKRKAEPRKDKRTNRKEIEKRNTGGHMPKERRKYIRMT
jgi:hypothetical protein